MDNNQIVPIEKNFSIFNRMLNIPENLDLFNSYRLIFRDLARQCTKELEIEYNKNIQNLDEFLSKFPCLYNNKIEPLIKAYTKAEERKGQLFGLLSRRHE